MTSQRDKPKRTQFGMREMFVVVTFTAITISLLQLPFFYPFVPLAIAVCFELCGWHKAAKKAAIVTLALWISVPLLAVLLL